jgi:hypothetical protein
MAENTLTLALGGNVSLDIFAQTMGNFEKLVDLLTKYVGGGAGVSWVVEDLSPGSTIVTIRGEAPEPEVVQKVGRAYVIIGHSLERGDPIPYSPEIVKAAESITQILNGQVTSIQFEAGNEVATVTSGVLVEQAAGLVGAYGSVEGRIETLTHRRWLGFTLYDLLHDRGIRCYLEPEQADLARGAWDQRVVVQGWIRRDPATGLPVSISPVLSIEPVPEREPGSFLRARGIAPAGPNEPSPEEAIRRIRDA